MMIKLQGKKIQIDKNRSVSVCKKEDDDHSGYVLIFKNKIEGRLWHPALCKRNKDNLVTTTIALSTEASVALVRLLCDDPAMKKILKSIK